MATDLPLWASRATFPARQVVRELRPPVRSWMRTARAGHDLSGLDAIRERRLGWRQPFELLRRVVGTPSRTGPIWAVTMVKDEEVRLPGAIRRLVADSVDVVLVADNGSTDGTRDVLGELAAELPVIVVSDREPAYYQGAKMSNLARVAARHGASWIVPFDADELWFGIEGTIAERLRSLEGDAAVARMYDFLPPVDARTVEDPYRTLTRRTADAPVRKVAFRAHLLASVATGNHTVGQPVREVRDALYIRHYPFLGFDHFVRKGVEGGRALAATTLPRNLGEHWREWSEAEDEERRRAWVEQVSRATVDDPLPPGAFGPS